jgi:hypothetical protein
MSPRIGLSTVRTSFGPRNAAGLRGLVLYVRGSQSSWLVRPYTLTTVRLCRPRELERGLQLGPRTNKAYTYTLGKHYTQGLTA